MVVEVTYLTWTEDNLLRQVSYLGQREDTPAKQAVRVIPHPLITRCRAFAVRSERLFRFIILLSRALPVRQKAEVVGARQRSSPSVISTAVRMTVSPVVSIEYCSVLGSGMPENTLARVRSSGRGANSA